MLLKAGLAGGAIALVGALGALWYSSECSDGKVVRNSWQCVRNAGFEPAFCNGLFAAEEEAIRRAPAVFATRESCMAQFPNCAESKRPVGWSARPNAYCLVRDSEGRIATITPTAG